MVDQDVFSLPSEFSIAFCVSEDLCSFSGFPIDLKYKIIDYLFYVLLYLQFWVFQNQIW